MVKISVQSITFALKVRLRLFYSLPVLAVGTALSTTASFLSGSAWLMPILGAAVAYPVFLYFVYHRQSANASLSMLFWAIFQSLAVIIGTVCFPQRAAEVILTGPAAAQEMFHWIQTGEGAEGSLKLFLPLHLRNYLIFCLLSLLTLSSTALIFGTWMLNYMNYYVAQLVLVSVHPGLALAVGWPPWSILRVIGFILTGVALATVGLNLIKKYRHNNFSHYSFPQQYLWMGLGFVVADLIVKATLAPLWRQLLAYALWG